MRLLTEAGRLRAARGFESVGDADAILVCMPTPLDANRTPDLSAVEAGVGAIADHLKPEALVVLESTIYPGTTREVVLPILERGGLVRTSYWLSARSGSIPATGCTPSRARRRWWVG